MNDKNDSDVVQQVRDGNRAAFALLYDRYARLVRCLCYDATSSFEDANDLTQDIFLNAFRRLPTLQKPDRFRYWLVGITRNAIIDFHRKQKRSLKDSSDEMQEPLAPESYDLEPFAELRTMIAQMPEKERMALHLFYLDDQPIAAAKELMSLSQSGFYKLLGRARAILQEMLAHSDRAD